MPRKEIVTFARVRPGKPNIYIEADDAVQAADEAFRLCACQEAEHRTSREYIAGRFFWNAGIFL